MKIFWPVFGAILLAFAIIFGVKALYDQNQRTQKAYNELKAELAKPIPPSHWQTETTPVVANDTQVQQLAAPEIQSPALEYVILARDVEVSHGVKKILIPKGSKLPVVSRGSRIVGVRFEGEQEIIPESATSKSK